MTTKNQHITNGQRTTLGKVKAVSDWVSMNIDYNWAEEQPNAPFTWQQATQTYALKLGVCQDEAAVAASMLRSIGIPTQVMQGELVVRGHDLVPHAWDRSWDGTGWINFDPTFDQVYYSQSQSSPTGLDDSSFDQPDAAFDQTHQDISVSPW